ncbi:hypothetical protein [Nocardioides dilutus]
MTGATFERGAFESTLDKVGLLLGDLWAVDEALKLADPDHVRQSGGPVSPYGRVGVDIGRHHSFRASIFYTAPEQSSSPGTFPGVGDRHDGAQQLVDELADRGREWGSSVAESIRSAVQDLVRPVPGAFQDAVETLRGTLTNPLSTLIADDFAHLASHLSDWEGVAADEFADYFYNQVEVSVRNQAFVAESVCVGLAGSKAIVHLGQHSLMGMVLSAHDVLDDQLRQRQAAHAATGPSTSDWLLIGATFLALAAAIPTGGGSLSIATAGVAAASASSALLEFAASQVEDGQTVTFEAISADEAMGQLFDRTTQIRDHCATHWTQLADSVGELRGLVAQIEGEHLLYPRRPRLADGDVSPGSFHHESAS